MVLEQGIPDFWAWLFGVGESWGAIGHWLVSIAAILGVSLVFSWLISIVFRGPKRGTITVFSRFTDATVDLVKISPRRVASLTILCFREAMRRWAWVALVIYLILLAFAGFFLDPTTNDPAKLYMDFVMTTAAGLVAMIVLFLSVFSIPNDITRRTIYTVVTKPVRASEIILGRTFGFSAVATLLLLGMGLASYLFVNRAIDHVHGFDPRQASWDYTQDADGRHPTLVGQTEYESNHRHEARVLLKKLGGQWRRNVTEIMHGHNHDIETKFESAAVSSFTKTDAGYDLTIPGHSLVINDKCLISPAEQVTDPSGTTDYVYDAAALTVTGVSDDDVVSVSIFENGELSPGTLASGNPMLHKVVLPLTSPQGLLTARVPVYASDFYFNNKAGEQKRAGVNVGNVWEYRSYVEGGSSTPGFSSVVWVFDGITADNYPIADYPNGLPLEFMLSIFRTHKGDIEQGVLGSLTLYNPEELLRSRSIIFEAKEFT
ncbi:MAG: ABC transporter permease, partial [Pirellulales bacterium]|nr:ABC transporter permease [Pirellulales bacterium]